MEMSKRVLNPLNNLVLVLGFISLVTSCAAQNKEKSLKGNWEDGKYENDFFILNVPVGWYEQITKEENQFLILAKEGAGKDSGGFSPNMVLIGIKKQEYSDKYKIKNFDEYCAGINAAIKSNKALKLVSKNNTLPVNNTKFRWSEYLISRPNNPKLLQKSYSTEMGEYYLTILTTEEAEKPEPQLMAIIQSIKLK